MQRMKLILLAIALLGVFAGCQKKETVPDAVKRADEGLDGGSGSTSTTMSKEFNVGDAETSIELVLELDPASASDSVKEEQVLTAKKTLSQAAVTVSGPAPGELWVRIRIKPNQPFVERTVVLRGVLTRDNAPIAQFQTVLGKYSLQDEPEHPKVFRVNVLDGLSAVPETMLLFAKAEVLLAPKGTDEATIDPATLAADQGDTSAKISNPLRITVVGGSQPAPAETPAAAAETSSPAADAAPAPAQ